MRDDEKGILGDREATGEQIRQAWEYAAVEAMKDHHRAGVPVTTWDWVNQRMVVIPADEIIIPEDHAINHEPSPVE